MSDKIEEQIEEIKAAMLKTQRHKGTESWFGTQKARIAQLQNELLEKAIASRAKKGSGFSIKKHGDATVILLGYPSVGKSTLLNAITNKDSKVAAYEFTTLDAIPGMMEYDGKYKGSKVQILDLPGIIRGGATGKGRGREIFATVRNADLILILLEPEKLDHLQIIFDELYSANIRLDKKPPRVRVKKKERGGIFVTGFPTKTSTEEIQSVLRTFRLMNADVFLNEPNLTIDHIIDHVAENRKYVPSLIVVNKVDLLTNQQLKNLRTDLGREFLPISAEHKRGLDVLKETIVEKIGLIRVFLKKPGEKTDFDEPLIINNGFTIDDICLKLHRRFRDDFRYANVWGKSAKFPAQKVGLSHKVIDGDVIKIVLEK